MFDSNGTYHQFTEDQHNEKVWISQPGAGLDKRQCSLKLCFSLEGKQPPLGIAYQKIDVLPGSKMFTCFFKKMRG